jgi:OOP family OmpA-OmpF porin
MRFFPIVLFFLCSMLFIVQAQPTLSTSSKKAISLYEEADNFRVRGEFDRAIDLLVLAIDKDPKFEEAYYRLAITYKSKEDFFRAIKNFERGLQLVKDAKRRRDYLYELTQHYLKLGDYKRSDTAADQFLKAEQVNKTKIEQVMVWQKQAYYALAHSDEKLNYHYAPLTDSVNRFTNQYFPVLTADNSELFFTVRQGAGITDNEDIVVSMKDSGGNWLSPTSISGQINSKAQEGACTVSADGRQLIFTMCGGVTYGRCDLFESRKVGGEWSRPTNLGPLVNSADWEGQPTLSDDGNVLYFSSSRKGGLGGYDIWTAKKDESGKWMKAQNLGSSVNTKYDEISPFIHVNGQTLYFSSNGYEGFGGYDIYQVERKNGGWTRPSNLGAPLNDFEDQFSFFVTSDGTTAYFSKADVANHGYSKLYKTTLPNEMQPFRKSFSVRGIVRDSETAKPLKAKIELSDQQLNERISRVESDSVNGSYLFVLTKGASYSLFVTSEGYLFKTYSFVLDSSKNDQPLQLDIDLKPIRNRASAVLNNIFFDYDKFEIKTESYSELAQIIQYLKQNPSMVIEIAGHTDNQGPSDYNYKLSQKRAQAVADYLIKNGISKEKIKPKGFGASKPISDNNSEKNRQANRRIEFIVVE